MPRLNYSKRYPHQRVTEDIPPIPLTPNARRYKTRKSIQWLQSLPGGTPSPSSWSLIEQAKREMNQELALFHLCGLK